MGSLEGKTVLVTGSSQGLGKGLAVGLAATGANIVINYVHNNKAAQTTVENIKKINKNVISCPADVTGPKSVLTMFEKINSTFGPVDILINNVGDFLQKPLCDTSTENWDQIIQSNLYSVFYCCKAAVPAMKKKRWGRIINIGLVNANRNQAFKLVAPYAIAKSGVLTLSKSLAVEVARFGITVNVVSPGLMDNGSLSTLKKTGLAKKVPMKRLGDSDDLLAIAKFLLSEKAAYITGADIAVSGGWGL
jgi:NAD(P)-dependent dehydrogenase (short-subunit alcohol dehydrogenase family)